MTASRMTPGEPLKYRKSVHRPLSVAEVGQVSEFVLMVWTAPARHLAR
jgi:hypothetical protein